MTGDMVKKGDRLHQVMKMWNDAIFNTKSAFLQMGQAIHIIKNEKLWKLMGDHVLSFEHFCTHELHISVSQANRLHLVYRELGFVLEDVAIDISKVTILLPQLTGKTEEEKRDIILGAKDLTVEAIRNNIKEKTGHGTATDECAHEETEPWEKCKKCGAWLKV